MPSTLHGAVTDLIGSRVGTTVRGKWKIDSLVGTGGMAAVYAATHRNGNRVALKVLHAQLSVDQSLRTRFTREGYVANTVNHPGVVRVLDDDVTEDGAAFLVMELLEGETTAMRADRMGGRLPVRDVLEIMDGLLDVLATAHAAGVVHRDVKPENVFFTHAREVKVLDFGIARLQETARRSGAMSTSGAMGTPAFMPPEQALGRMEEVDALSDLWATGATAYTLLSGRLVHDLDTPNEVLVAAATRPAQSLISVVPDVPIEIAEVVDRSLAFYKKQRWSSARAMQHGFRRAASAVLSTGEFNLARNLSAPDQSGRQPVAGNREGAHPDTVPAPAPDSLINSVRVPNAAALPPMDSTAATAAQVLPAAPPPMPVRSWVEKSVAALLLVAIAVGCVVAFLLYNVRKGDAAVASDPTTTGSAHIGRPAPSGEPSTGQGGVGETPAPPSTGTGGTEATPAGDVQLELPASRPPRNGRTAPGGTGSAPAPSGKEKSWLDRRN